MLTLQHNDLSGVIPTEIGRLTVLRHLNLTNCKLHGPLPPELGQLWKLFSVTLSENNLRGGIPKSWLTGLTNLVTLGK